MLRVLSQLVAQFRPRPPSAGSLPAVPEGTRIYAVGDIHGELALLDNILTLIAADVRTCTGSGKDVRIVFLGDYVDRGADSRGVLERLQGLSLAGTKAHFLMGNHEKAMLDFIDNPGAAGPWLAYGGLETLTSYGIRASAGSGDRQRWISWAEALAARIPPAHLSFLRGLDSHLMIGDYLFVHAGVRPAKPLAAQTLEDMLWIREPFLSWRRPHEKFVVHGHSVSEEVDAQPNRIGIDTGAYATGRLTALVLEGTSRRLLQT